MFGAALLVLAISLYVLGRKRWSLLLFISFLSNGFEMLTDDVIGVKNADLAVMYMVVVSVFSYLREPKNTVEDPILRRLVLALFFFLLASVAFSYQYYKFTPYQIVQGGRHLFLFASYFFIIKTKSRDILWLVEKIYKITLVVSVLYIGEVLFGWRLMPYAMEVKIELSTGLGRFYNSPLYLPLSIYLAMFRPKTVHVRNRTVELAILFLAQICTQGRVEIVVTFMMVFLGTLLINRRSTAMRVMLVTAIMMMPVMSILQSRFANDDSSSDVRTILQGGYKDISKKGATEGGTLTYRFAWIYERYMYLKDRPFGEKVFGLGMITDSQTEEVLQRYHFFVGLELDETGMISQMSTPDIAYGNLLTRFGYVGGLLLLAIWLYMAYRAYQMRKFSPYEIVLAILLTGYMIRSLSGSTISETRHIIVPFMLFTLYCRMEKNEKMRE